MACSRLLELSLARAFNGSYRSSIESRLMSHQTHILHSPFPRGDARGSYSKEANEGLYTRYHPTVCLLFFKETFREDPGKVGNPWRTAWSVQLRYGFNRRLLILSVTHGDSLMVTVPLTCTCVIVKGPIQRASSLSGWCTLTRTRSFTL